MYNSNSNPPAATPTSPLTPTTPPAISPAAQAPQVAPQTQQQPPPKKSLSLTVSKTRLFFTAAFDVDWKTPIFIMDLIRYVGSSWPLDRGVVEPAFFYNHRELKCFVALLALLSYKC